jgi:LIVCS family branched-chain amino acid:cation transporter
MYNKKSKDIIVVGFALFAMFFGAGNVIFPPLLGFLSGDQWNIALFGFVLTSVGMPLLGVIAIAKNGGAIEHLAGKVSPTFSKILGTIIVLAIGPLLAIPRTCATTFEMGVQPLFPHVSPILSSIVFFAITLFFVINPSTVVDKIGKILTPVLLLAVWTIIIKGIISPIDVPIHTGLKNAFSTGFTEGYQTMDALASLLFAGIIIADIAAKGYPNVKEQIKLTMLSGVIAAISLLFIYGGLMYLGATGTKIFPADIIRTQLTIGIAETLLGPTGKIILGITVAFACLTTAIGLTATAGNFFNKLTKNKLSYKTVVIIVTLFSTIVSNAGVELIVKLSVPLLVTVYPVTIVLILMGLFSNFIKHRGLYIGAVYGTLLISIFDGLSAAGVKIDQIHSLIALLPFAAKGFAWIIPAIVGAIVGMLFIKKSETQAV